MAGDRSVIEVFTQRMRCVPRLLSRQNLRFGGPLGDHDLADLAQDIAMIVWRKLGKYQGLGPLEAWINRICSLEFRNAIRSLRRRHGHFPGGETGHLEAIAAAFEDAELVRDALSRLGGPQADIIRAVHFEGLDFVEVACRAQLPLATVKSRYYRGLRKLERFLLAKSPEDFERAENKESR